MREGDSFNPTRWVRKILEEKAQARRVAAAFTSGESAASEIADATEIVNGKNAPASSAPKIMAKVVPIPRALRRSDHELRSETPESRLRRRLEKVCAAWETFQSSRDRDAIYPYLTAIFRTVEHYRVRHRTKDLVRCAFEFADLPYDGKSNAFAAIIRCTCDTGADNKTISKWARALRYAAHCGVPPKRLKAFIKELGGINECADRFAKYLGRGRR